VTVGRPSIYTEALAKRICEQLAKGVPLARICDQDDMPDYSTVRAWEDDKPEFSALSAHAKRNGTHYLADDSIRIADDPTIDPQHKRIMVDTRLRLIGKWNAKAYGDKVQTELSGPGGGPINVRKADLSDDELAAIATGGG
jgi:hypothetical protein